MKPFKVECTFEFTTDTSQLEAISRDISVNSLFDFIEINIVPRHYYKVSAIDVKVIKRKSIRSYTLTVDLLNRTEKQLRDKFFREIEAIKPYIIRDNTSEIDIKQRTEVVFLDKYSISK